MLQRGFLTLALVAHPHRTIPLWHRMQCPLCLTPQSPTQLLCSKCVGENLEIVKNVCDDNTIDIATNQELINSIFIVTTQIRNGECLEQLQIPKGVSLKVIKSLALQLLKSELINRHSKSKNIDRTIEVLQHQVIKLNETIIQNEEKVQEATNRLNVVENQLLEKYRHDINKIVVEVHEIQKKRNIGVMKHALQLQLTNLETLNDFAFVNIKGKGLLLYNQPVIEIGQFFKFNNKLIPLNQFLENLIILQGQLVSVLLVQLPYLKELQLYLPDSGFYNLIQEKEDFIIHGEKPDVIVNEPEEVQVNDLERIVKLGLEIKLPLLSKTLNTQRRASIVQRESVSDPVSPISNLPDRQGSLGIDDLGNERTILTSARKMVIIPHKIINKPFTKMKSNEYLNFILIIVKIIINFKVLFKVTINTIDSNSPLEDEESYNFTNIINKVNNLKEYLNHRLSEINANVYLTGKDTKPWKLTKFYNIFKDLSQHQPSTPEPMKSTNEPDIKLIMKHVHDLMTKHYYTTNSNFTLPTLNMMAQSKIQLDDWDVISKLY